MKLKNKSVMLYEPLVCEEIPGQKWGLEELTVGEPLLLSGGKLLEMLLWPNVK